MCVKSCNAKRTTETKIKLELRYRKQKPTEVFVSIVPKSRPDIDPITQTSYKEGNRGHAHVDPQINKLRLK